MSYRKRRPAHYMPVMGIIIGGDRYATCLVPGCMRVRRAYGLKPLIRKGRKP